MDGGAASSFSGTVSVNGSATLTLDGATTWSAGNWNLNGGTIQNDGELAVTGDTSVGNFGGSNLVRNLAGGTLTRTTSVGTASVNVPFDNAGLVSVQTGTLSTSSVTQSAGAIAVAASATFGANGASIALNGGTLRGGGTVRGDVTNSGASVQPGTSPGSLSVAGNYTQNAGGTLQAEIAGTTPGTGYDRLSVTGTATLGGTLAIVTDPGFDPALGSTYDVVTAATRNGTFASLSGAQLSGKHYEAEYGAMFARLRMVQDAVVEPANTTPPSIPASATQGDTLTCNPGTWTGSPSFAFEWLRDGVPIAGASGQTCALTAADVGRQITCRVTGTNSAGSNQASSNAVTPSAAPSPPPPPVPTPQPQPPPSGPPPLIVAGCLNADASVSGKRLGAAQVGRSRAAQRAIFKGANSRGQRDLDVYCAAGGGNFRIGYPTARLKRTLGIGDGRLSRSAAQAKRFLRTWQIQ